MKKLDLRSNLTNRFLEIPVEFIDRFMPSASSDELKVYLYLLRVSTDPQQILSISDMAELLDITKKRVAEALLHWANLDVLSLEFSDDEITGITLMPFSASQSLSSQCPEKAKTECEANEPTVSETKVSEPPTEVPMPRIDYTKLDTDPVFIELMALSEIYLKQPVTPAGKDALAYCYVLLHENSEMVEYLLEYCVDRGHSSFHYIKAVADAWYHEGYRSLNDIKEHTQNRNKTVYSILSEFGIRNREPARTELDYITTWASWFDLPVIQEACKRTMSNLHTPDFNYTNGILTRWKSSNVTSLRDIADLDAKHLENSKREQRKPKATVNAFHNFQGRNVDYDALFAGCQNP